MLQLHYTLVFLSFVTLGTCFSFIFLQKVAFFQKAISVFLMLQFLLIVCSIIRWQNLFTYGSSTFILFYIFFLRVSLKYCSFFLKKLFKGNSSFSRKARVVNLFVDQKIRNLIFLNKLTFWLFKISCYSIEVNFKRFFQKPEGLAKNLYRGFFILLIFSFLIEFIIFNRILFTTLFLSIFFLVQRLLLVSIKQLKFYCEGTLLDLTRHPYFFRWFNERSNTDKIKIFYQRIENINNILYLDGNFDPKYLANKYEVFSKIANYNKSYYSLYALERYFIPYYRNWLDLIAFIFFTGFYLINLSLLTNSFFKYFVAFDILTFLVIFMIFFAILFKPSNFTELSSLLNQQVIMITEIRDVYKEKILERIGANYRSLFHDHPNIFNFQNHHLDKPVSFKDCFEKT